MFQRVILGLIFLMFLNKLEINAAQDLYGRSSGRIKPLSDDKKVSKILNNYPQGYQLSHAYERSPTFMQSRRFHIDPMLRFNRNQNQPLLYQSQKIPILDHRPSGINTNIIGSNQEGCRLTNNYCSHDYQCCSGKCRCVRWSVMGKMSCWKKCF